MATTNYHIMLQEMEARRNQCVEEIKALDQVIAGLRHLSQNNGAAALPLTQRNGAAVEDYGEDRRYVGMSVRWATLYLLSEHTSKPLRTGEIASMLKHGGLMSQAESFNANVSAVLSGMVRQRKEVEQVDEGYRLTDIGRQAWAAIKNTPQWLSRQGEKG